MIACFCLASVIPAQNLPLLSFFYYYVLLTQSVQLLNLHMLSVISNKIFVTEYNEATDLLISAGREYSFPTVSVVFTQICKPKISNARAWYCGLFS